MLELPAPESGVLAKIAKGDGGTVTSNEVIATIDTEAKPAAAAKVAAAPPVSLPAPAAKSAPALRAVESPASKVAESIVMPAARKIASDQGMDLGTVQGTGRGGRITKEDVVAQIAPCGEAKHQPAESGGYLEGAGRSARAARAHVTTAPARRGRLLQSQSTAAILTTFNEVNMQPVMELRKNIKSASRKSTACDWASLRSS